MTVSFPLEFVCRFSSQALGLCQISLVRGYLRQLYFVLGEIAFVTDLAKDFESLEFVAFRRLNVSFFIQHHAHLGYCRCHRIAAPSLTGDLKRLSKHALGISMLSAFSRYRSETNGCPGYSILVMKIAGDGEGVLIVLARCSSIPHGQKNFTEMRVLVGGCVLVAGRLIQS